jgi:hypothetical protein
VTVPLFSLERQLVELYRSGIYVGIQATPSGFLLWMCDRTYTRRIDHLMPGQEASPVSIGDWLHANALEHFPDSAYANSIVSRRVRAS